MRNVYYYSFYLLSMFAKKVNKRNSEYAFSGMACLSVLIWFNIYTLLLSPLRLFNILKVKGSVFYIGVMLCVLITNYYLLIADNKSETIIHYYNEHKEARSKKRLIGFCMYVAFTLLLAALTGYLVRNNTTG